MADIYIAFYCGENYFDSKLVEIFAYSEDVSRTLINKEAEYIREEHGAEFVEWDSVSKQEYNNFCRNTI